MVVGIFLSAIINATDKTSQIVLCNRADGVVWTAPLRTFTGTLNPSCTADIVMGMHANQYYYAGGLDEWFFETDSDLTIDDLIHYFRQAMLANGGDTSGNVDALTEPGAVTLRKGIDNLYPESGQLTTIATECSLAGSGRVSATSEYTSGVTSISLIETSTSDDMQNGSAWRAVSTNGELTSPNRSYIRYRGNAHHQRYNGYTKLLDITLHDIPKSPYEKLGFAALLFWMRTERGKRFWRMLMTSLLRARSTERTP